jgi:outer membrane protein OmpA-like peptidoglycan-associated protein
MADEKFVFIVDNTKGQPVEGEFHQIDYNYPKTASKAQVVRNLNTAVRQAGYTMLHDSGDAGDFTGHMGKTWIYITISVNGSLRETIVTETALTQDVTATAAALSGGLAASGHTVVNGIQFDTGKAEVKPESTPALEEVLKLLKQEGKLKLYVVGHTDNVGALAANVDLSDRRAAAVVQIFVTKYGITADRLQPHGAGPYSPLASNSIETGRAVNRRVELVQQ